MYKIVYKVTGKCNLRYNVTNTTYKTAVEKKIIGKDIKF